VSLRGEKVYRRKKKKKVIHTPLLMENEESAKNIYEETAENKSPFSNRTSETKKGKGGMLISHL